MGMGSNIIILMFVLSFALYMGTPEHESSLFFSVLTGSDHIYSTIQAQLLIIAGLGILGGVASGLFSGSITYAIFGGITTILGSFVVLPTSVLLSASIPDEFKVLLIGVFGLLYILTVLDFFRGTGSIS